MEWVRVWLPVFSFAGSMGFLRNSGDNGRNVMKMMMIIGRVR